MDREAMIAALIFGGSGSGGGLPAVTGADNGKVLGVANGAWGAVADKGEPFYVTFTITGAAVDNVYPLSADKTLVEISTAIDAGYDIIGACNIGGTDTPCARIASVEYDSVGDLESVSFTILGLINSSPVMGIVSYENNIRLIMTPLSAAQMTYDSGTQTLAIYAPLA